MPSAGLRPARTGTSLARAESRAREARERGLQEGNAGRPAVGARYIRAGLRQLGWAEAGGLPDAERIHAAHLNAAHVQQARADLTWCRRVATDEGYHMIAAKTLHNLGYCELLTGDIPAALQLFNEAASAYQDTAPAFLPVLANDKARALLA